MFTEIHGYCIVYSVIWSNIALLTCQNKVEKMSFVRKLQQFVPFEREWQISDILCKRLKYYAILFTRFDFQIFRRDNHV